MKKIYSIVASFLIVGFSFAQNINTNIKMAQKKSIDNNLPKVIKIAGTRWLLLIVLMSFIVKILRM